MLTRIKKLVVVAVAILATALSVQAAADKPNIVLIMSDDVGMEWLGSYGNAEGLTPNLDKLATEGVRFTNCYSLPLCTPSRVEIMTGRYAFRNYKGFDHLAQSEVTFGNLLKQAGYNTCVVGKWQLSGLASKNESSGKGKNPAQAGFDENCCWSLDAQGSRYMDPTIETNGVVKTYTGGYGPDIVQDYASNILRSIRTNRFSSITP